MDLVFVIALRKATIKPTILVFGVNTFAGVLLLMAVLPRFRYFNKNGWLRDTKW